MSQVQILSPRPLISITYLFSLAIQPPMGRRFLRAGSQLGREKCRALRCTERRPLLRRSPPFSQHCDCPQKRALTWAHTRGLRSGADVGCGPMRQAVPNCSEKPPEGVKNLPSRPRRADACCRCRLDRMLIEPAFGGGVVKDTVLPSGHKPTAQLQAREPALIGRCFAFG